MEIVPRSLLQKYDRPGPRYTSYPPANHFHTGVGSEDYLRGLAAVPSGEPLSIYVHVPFCEYRCTYCGCFVIPTRKHSVSRTYLDYCLKELRLVRNRLAAPTRAAAVHLGGGTPTYLAPEEMEELFVEIRKMFELVSDVEIAVELDPRVTTEAHLDTLSRVGANRVSLGVQDTSEEVQEAIGRHQTRENTLEFFQLCRDRSFENINIDLVYGLPRQTEERFERTLDDVLTLRPERFAIFGYAHVPWAKPNQKRLDVSELPGPEDRLRLYLLAHRRLTTAGYRHIGMDHFALPDDDLSRAQEERRLGRNFMGYIPRGSLKIVGIGLSSIGDLSCGYYQNEKKLSRYYERLDRDELPVERGFLTSPDDLARRYVIHEILCNLRVDFAEFERRYGSEFRQYFATELDDVRDLVNDGLVEQGEADLRVQPAGTLLVRNIAMVFDRYLRERPSLQASYSRTV